VFMFFVTKYVSTTMRWTGVDIFAKGCT